MAFEQDWPSKEMAILPTSDTVAVDIMIVFYPEIVHNNAIKQP